VTYTKCHIDTIDSPDDEHSGARNMYRIGINIYEKGIVRKVGYLQGWIGDARSENIKNLFRVDRRTGRHMEAQSRFSQFCEKRPKSVT
jgi:hypothetical protein